MGEPDLDIDIDDVNIGNNIKAPAAKKKAVTESVERLESELVDAKLNGELSGEKDSADGGN